MKNTVIITITGRKRSGKDLAAKCIHELIPVKYPVARISISEEIKAVLANLTNGDVQTINTNKDSPMLRRMLQAIGDEGRKKDPCYWMTRWHSYAKGFEGMHKTADKRFIIVPDLRLLSELEFLKLNYDQVFSFRVDRPQLEMDLSDEGRHITETETEKIPIELTILNHQTELYLSNEVKHIVKYVMEKIEK